MNVREIANVDDRFNISETEAARIAATVDNEDEFVVVWENTDWWLDANNEVKL